MRKNHVLLKNDRKKNDKFLKTRGRSTENPSVPEEIEEPSIKDFQIENLRKSYSSFQASYESRNKHRTIEFPNYIDFIEIRFFSFFSKSLKEKFYSRYGLLNVSVKDFNKTVIFEIVDKGLFEAFKRDVKFISESIDNVPYSGEEYDIIATIYKFSFINKRNITEQDKNIILSLFQTASAETSRIQKKSLEGLFLEKQIKFTKNESESIFHISELDYETKDLIEKNYDVVQAIKSSRPLTVRPGFFGTTRFEYGFKADIDDNLPLVGIIDSGVNEIEPFKGLISDDKINITGLTDNDIDGHGTLVAGLTIFGSELPREVKSNYTAKCKVFPIKAIHNGTDGIDFPLLLGAIVKAHTDYGIRLFNMSLEFYPKEYNEAFSDFAYELDVLSFKYDILIFISVGNFNSINLRDLLNEDYHEDHLYPDFFYKPESTSDTHRCANTNISSPSESLNNLSVGALAGNIEGNDNSDISPLSQYPAYYTRKFHFDYDQKINTTELGLFQKNKHLNKPDFVYDGGDLFNENSGIEVLADPNFGGKHYLRTCGTSLSTPIVTSMAAEILKKYPKLNVQTVKALLVNSSSFYKTSTLTMFRGKEPLLKKLTGFGIPNSQEALNSSNQSVTFIIEDQIKPSEFVAIPLNLPDYLKTAKNKLIIDIALCYKFPPDRGNHLNYLPLHISFNIVQDMDVKEIAENNSSKSRIKSGFSWSEDHFGKENRLFSNAQYKQYKLQPKDIQTVDGSISIVIRSVCKSEFNNNDLKDFLESNTHDYSLVVKVTEEKNNPNEYNLYDEITNINTIEVIGDIELEADLNN